MRDDFQDIGLKDLLVAIIEKWWLVLLGIVLAGGITYWISVSYYVPVYNAQSTLFIGKDPSVVASINVNDLRIGDELINDYQELIQSRLVTEKVLSNLGYRMDSVQLKENLAIYLVKDSRFMYISYTDPNPDIAMEVANEYSRVLVEEAEAIVGVKNIAVVDYAIEPDDPIDSGLITNLTVSGLVGGMIGIFIIFIIMFFDNRMKSEEDVEELLGLPVLGSIPVFKGGEMNG